MTKIRLSSKGQLSIPKKIREQLNLQKGDLLSLEQQGEEIVLRPVKKSLLDLGGMLYSKGMESHTDEEIREGIFNASAERFKRHVNQNS